MSGWDRDAVGRDSDAEAGEAIRRAGGVGPRPPDPLARPQAEPVAAASAGLPPAGLVVGEVDVHFHLETEVGDSGHCSLHRAGARPAVGDVVHDEGVWSYPLAAEPRGGATEGQ